MVEQLVGVGDILDIEQFYFGVGLWVEVLIHILQHVLDAYLLAIADRPDTVELQALDDGTLEDEHGRGARAADEVGTLGRELGYGQCEHAVVAAVEHTDAVGADECGAVLAAGVQYSLLQLCALCRLLAEASRDDDEGPCLLLACQQLYIVRTEPGRHHEDGQVGGWQVSDVVTGGDTLHLVFLGVDHSQLALVAAADEVAHDGAARLVHVVGAAYDDDARRIQ